MLLEQEGYHVRTFSDGASALTALTATPPDLAILDIKMPRMDGLELLRRLRQNARPAGDLPHLEGRGDRRADGPQRRRRRLHPQAVLPAPAARAGARRCCAAPSRARAAPAAPEGKKEALVRGKLALDPQRHECTWDGKPVRLTVTEFLILQALAQRPGFVKSRDSLMDAAYDDQVYVDDRTIDSHIKRLRKKFKVGRRRFRCHRNALWCRLSLPRGVAPADRRSHGRSVATALAVLRADAPHHPVQRLRACRADRRRACGAVEPRRPGRRAARPASRNRRRSSPARWPNTPPTKTRHTLDRSTRPSRCCAS